jgi:hypothetical protein
LTADSWIVNSLGTENVREATVEASRRRLQGALGIAGPADLADEQLRFISNGLELRVLDLLDDENTLALLSASAEAFQVAGVLSLPSAPVEAAEALVRLGCLGVLGDRGTDVRRLLIDNGLPALPLKADEWGVRVWATVLDMWLRLFHRDGWSGLDAVLSESRGFVRTSARTKPRSWPKPKIERTRGRPGNSCRGTIW